MPDMRRWMQADHNVSETGGREVPCKQRKTSAGVVQNVFFPMLFSTDYGWNFGSTLCNSLIIRITFVSLSRNQKRPFKNLSMKKNGL